jgi:hypothetical protein
VPPIDVPKLTHTATLKVLVAKPLVIGPSAEGLREIIPITGGTVEGPLFRGTVIPGGADWCLTHGDGVAEVWARYAMCTDDGHIVSITNTGFAHPNGDGSYAGRTMPRFEVGDGPLAWLRRSIFVGTLHAHASGEQVDLDFYRVD